MSGKGWSASTWWRISAWCHGLAALLWIAVFVILVWGIATGQL